MLGMCQKMLGLQLVMIPLLFSSSRHILVLLAALMVTSFLNVTLGIQKGSPADAINRSLIQSKEKGARSIRLPKTPWKTTGLAKTLASSPL